ncbi:MAG: response regulator [Nitrospira sp.]
MSKILIADDSIAVRKVAERLLTEAGMVVSLAANGTEALAFLGRECPDLVVSDVIMPDKSGYEVCSFVRAQPNLAAVPVLLISGIVNDEVTRQAECCHADGVLKKPFQGTSLKDRVQDLLTKRRDKTQAGPAVPASSNGNLSAGTPQFVHSSNPDDRLPDHCNAELKSAVSSAMAPQSADPVPVPDSFSNPDREALHARLAELEAACRDAGDRAHQMETRWKEAEPLMERAGELEKTLAEARREWEERERDLQSSLQDERARNLESTQRAEQLAASLVDEQRRAEELAVRAAEIEPLSMRLAEVESTLAVEREAAALLATNMSAEDARKAARISELEATLTTEREAAALLATNMSAEDARKAARISELEATLTTEREAAALLTNNMSAEDARKAARISELEATLAAERDAATQLVQQITALEKLEGRVKDLEARLASERDQSAELHNRIAELKQDSARAKELDAALIAERERCAQFETALSSERQQAAILVQQVTEFEKAVNRARELDTVLAGERERSTLLAKRATEAEHLADQSNRRLEDMARKLAEIAGLASQLGNSPR